MNSTWTIVVRRFSPYRSRVYHNVHTASFNRVYRITANSTLSMFYTDSGLHLSSDVYTERGLTSVECIAE